MLCPVCGLDNDPAAVLCARCNTSLALGNPPPGDYPPVPHPSTQAPDLQPTIVQTPVPSSPSPAPVPWRLVIVAAVLVLLVGIAGSVVIIVLTGKPKTSPTADHGTIALPTAVTSSADPGPDPTTKAAASSANEQAAVIDKLLDRSVASRTKLNKAIDKVNRCTDLSQALADMQRVGVERTREIAAADAADVSGLAGGEKIRSTLKSALGFALAADQHFVAWAQPAVAGGCADTAARQAAWAAGLASSQQAQAAKQKLVDAWNPVAAQFGLKQRTTQFI
ncbi:hypothetical protein ODJ79_17145 [Actinoplanes sp. KI2]|uniref:hypothetical protein n=1 Tax=Actinoplanes sp. KI2 TaxID=2983315 RepID=UPI0021D5D3F8|nr:hypothetical protein [Actinoplanes sp. KI2]MCU7725455.1 hypothetical protein [Actinoplanes sp. KI2]